jgi:hypothetical protein
MIMVPLEEPLDPGTHVTEVLEYLDGNEFDLAILRSQEIRLVYRTTLKALPAECWADEVATHASAPRGDRLAEHTLGLGEIARRLRDEDVPLLVVGKYGPEHIVSRADFTRPPGQAAALALLSVLDVQLDELLRPFEDEFWMRLPEERKRVLTKRVVRAQKRSEEVGWRSYLTIGERLEAVTALQLGSRLSVDLGSKEEHVLLAGVRNAIAHGREAPGADVIDALVVTERILDAIFERSSV